MTEARESKTLSEKKILVTEKIANEGLDVFARRGYGVDVRLDLSHEELIDVIGPYAGLVVRSATIVDKAVLDAATSLEIIGRAGVTTDNIDLEAATARGIIVCNAPTSNIISAAEHTMALMLACARRIPQASASMHDHRWERAPFTGMELFHKTLAIMGLGRVGGLVAERARGFGMKLIGYDPYCSPERASELNVELYESFDDILPVADIITVHLPRTTETLDMFGPEEFSRMKDGVILINAARGGIFNVDSLADFVAAGKVAAAAIDVFEREPCLESPLHEFDNVILTPHIAAVTREAQIRAGTEIADYVCLGLQGSIVPTAINTTVIPPEVLTVIAPYIPACSMVGRMIAQMLDKTPETIRIEAAGTLARSDLGRLQAGLLDGLLTYRRVGTVTTVNADQVAKRHGIHIEKTTLSDAGAYASLVRVVANDIDIAVTASTFSSQGIKIASFLGFTIDIVPGAFTLVIEYAANTNALGTLGTILGNHDVAIESMAVSARNQDTLTLAYLNLSSSLDKTIIDEIYDALRPVQLWQFSL